MTARVVMLLQAMLLVLATTTGTAQAAVYSTSDYVATEKVATDNHSTQLARVNAVLAQAEVREQLLAMGVSHHEATARVAALSPAELQLLNQRMDELPAGGSILGVIGAVFVVLLILELVGVTDVFSKV